MRGTIGIAALVLGLLAGEAALAQSFGEPAPRGQGSRIRTFRFDAAPQPTPIPGSRDAAFCALTAVDDDTPRGFCRVFFDPRTGEWMHQTGGGGGDNQCEATCLMSGAAGRQDPDGPDDRPPPRRRPPAADEEEDFRPAPRDRFGRVQPDEPSREAAAASCRAPRPYRFTLKEPQTLRCTPNRIPVFQVSIPDSGYALARASLLYANDSDAAGGPVATYFWNASVAVGNGTEIAVGDDICPGDETAPKPVLGYGRLDRGGNSTVRVNAASGSSPCRDGSVTVLPGSTLEVWVEDPSPACRGRDVGFASSLAIPAFREQTGWRWSAEMRRMLGLKVPEGPAERRSLTILATTEATPRTNPNQVCGQEGAGARASIVVAGQALATRALRFPASQGMGHVVIGLEATVPGEAAAPVEAELWGSTNAPNSDVFTGGCCGEAMLGFVRQ